MYGWITAVIGSWCTGSLPSCKICSRAFDGETVLCRPHVWRCPPASSFHRSTACPPESSWLRASGTWRPRWPSATPRTPRLWRRRASNAARRWPLRWRRDAASWSTRGSWRSPRSCWKRRTSPASCRLLARPTTGSLSHPVCLGWFLSTDPRFVFLPSFDSFGFEQL